MKRLKYILIILLATGALLPAQDDGMYKIEKLPISSGAYNDMTPVIFNNSMVFCSDRRFYGWSNKTNFEGQKLYGIYKAEIKDSLDYGKVDLFSKDIQSIGTEGPFCFTPDGNQIYFTRTMEVGKRAKRKGTKSNNNGIFIADRQGEGWSDVRPFEYNDPLWMTAHPCISPDGKYLFFASNTPGGQGMSDIYICEWVNGKWTKPVNLGPEINSPKADLYPWFNSSGELFFASDRSGGMGGLDIYTTRLSFGKWSRPTALPEPVNSPYNDFSYITESLSSNGYFTSDRDKNDDIYSFRSLIIRKAHCDELVYDRFCYLFEEENAVRFDSLPYEYEWDFDDGKRAQGVTAEHCFENPGTYIVKLNVVDKITGDIQYNEVSYILDIQRTEQAFITGPDTIYSGSPVLFDASNTNLPGWEIREYYWNFDDGSIARGEKTEKSYVAGGAYNVQLIVSSEPDSNGVVNETCVTKIVVVNQRE